MNRKFSPIILLKITWINILTQFFTSLSPCNDNSSESGSESTSPESSSEESNYGSTKVDSVPAENNKWCLSSFVQTKSIQPSQDSQPPVTNIKHEPNAIDEDIDVIYGGQLMPNSVIAMKDIYQQPTIPNNYDIKSHSNCDLVVDKIKQEPGECLSDCSIFFMYTNAMFHVNHETLCGFLFKCLSFT